MSVRLRSIGLAVLLFGTAAMLGGCQAEDEIQRYRVPRLDQATRLLGAVAARPDQTWFFKLVGPEPAVAAHEKEFDQFIRSLRFRDDDKDPVQWTLPAGWSKVGSSERLRFATLRLGSEDAPLELTVTQLGGEAGSLLANVNRWRNQIGLGELPAAQLSDVTRDLDVNGQKVVLVDMKGPGAGRAMAAPAPRMAPAGDKPPTVRFQPQPGWKQAARAVPFSLHTFEVGDGSGQALITVSPLSGPSGGLANNILRWRGQIGLGPVDEAQLNKDVRDVTVNGIRGQFVDLLGPAAGGKPAQRLLAAVLPHGGRTWFIKMVGPAELVAKQKDAFEAFVQSMQFE